MGNQRFIIQNLFRVLTDSSAEFRDIPCKDGKACCLLVSAKPGKKIPAGRKGPVQIKSRDTSGRSHALLSIQGQDDRRTVVPFGYPGSHNPDHTGMPSLPGHHKKAVIRQIDLIRKNFLYGLQNTLLGLPAVPVAPDQLLRHRQGLIRPGSGQQLISCAISGHSSRRIQTRCDGKGYFSGVHGRRLHLQLLQQSGDSGAGLFPNLTDPQCGKRPVLSRQRNHIRHRPQCNQIQERNHSFPSPQCLNQFGCDPHSCQLPVRVGLSGDLRIDHGKSIRQGGSRHMMIRNDDVHVR